MFKDNVTALRKELRGYHHSKSDAMMIAVQSRLNNALQSYCEEVEESVGYLSRRNSLRMMNRINRRDLNNGESDR